MNGNQYYEAEKDGHEWQSNSSKLASKSRVIRLLYVSTYYWED